MIKKEKNAPAGSYRNGHLILLDDLTLKGIQNIITDILIRINSKSTLFKKK
jgi:hypothetical protein